MTHNVFRIIKKERTRRYLCDECNTSYPNRKSMLADHTEIIAIVKDVKI